MDIKFSDERNALVMDISGEFDHRYSIRIRNEADRKIVTFPDKHFIFDLSKVSFMDSSAIGVILGRYKLVSWFNGKISIISPNKTLLRILEMSGIPKIIPIYNSLDDALNI